MNDGLLITDHFLDGACYVEPEEERVELTAPRTAAHICDVPLAGARTVDAAVRSASHSRWSQVRARDRGLILHRIADALADRQVEFAKAEALDTGKSVDDAHSIDVANAIRWLEYAAGWPKRIEGAVLPVDGPHLAFTEREPVGTVAAITAWNYPLMLAVWKVAPALAAGCPVVLKPSERAPLTCLLFGQLCVEAGLPPSVLNVIVGGPQAGALLVAHEDVAKVSFTGSVAAGRDVAQACAIRGKACTTELGGKSAAIVLRDASDRPVADVIVDGLLHNAGQACNAPTRLLYRPADEDELFSAIDIRMNRVRDFGPLIDDDAVQRVNGYVERALDGGAEAVTSTPLITGGYRAPGVVLKVEPDHEVARHEIFGPVLAAIPCADPVAVANGSPYDLAAGVFGPLERCIETARRLRAGHVYLNCWSVQDPCAPFGGMGGSGLGREHGREGLDAYLRTKTVYTQIG